MEVLHPLYLTTYVLYFFLLFNLCLILLMLTLNDHNFCICAGQIIYRYRPLNLLCLQNSSLLNMSQFGRRKDLKYFAVEMNSKFIKYILLAWHRDRHYTPSDSTGILSSRITSKVTHVQNLKPFSYSWSLEFCLYQNCKPWCNSLFFACAVYWFWILPYGCNQGESGSDCYKGWIWYLV